MTATKTVYSKDSVNSKQFGYKRMAQKGTMFPLDRNTDIHVINKYGKNNIPLVIIINLN